MYRTDSRTSQHGNRRLGYVWHINDNAFAFFDLVPFQHIREAADFAMQLLIGERAFVTGLAFPNDRRLVPTRAAQMPVQTIFAGV